MRTLAPWWAMIYQQITKTISNSGYPLLNQLCVTQYHAAAISPWVWKSRLNFPSPLTVRIPPKLFLPQWFRCNSATASRNTSCECSACGTSLAVHLANKCLPKIRCRYAAGNRSRTLFEICQSATLRTQSIAIKATGCTVSHAKKFPQHCHPVLHGHEADFSTTKESNNRHYRFLHLTVCEPGPVFLIRLQ